MLILTILRLNFEALKIGSFEKQSLHAYATPAGKEQSSNAPGLHITLSGDANHTTSQSSLKPTNKCYQRSSPFFSVPHAFLAILYMDADCACTQDITRLKPKKSRARPVFGRDLRKPRRLHDAAITTTGLGLAHIHFLLGVLALRLTVNELKAHPVGSVTLAIWVAGREGIEEHMAQVRLATFADDLQTPEFCLRTNMAATSLLRVVALVKYWPSAIAPELGLSGVHRKAARAAGEVAIIRIKLVELM